MWDLPREQLPDEAALLYSTAMIEGSAEYEADLVVAWPGAGIAVVEVKGGQVSRRLRQWYQSSAGLTRPILDPVMQAQDRSHMPQGRGSEGAGTDSSSSACGRLHAPTQPSPAKILVKVNCRPVTNLVHRPSAVG